MWQREAMNISRHPSRAAVDRALREAEVLWRPPHDARNIIPFRRVLRTCSACGQHLDAAREVVICTTCLAWDEALRGLAISKRALG